MIKDPFLKYYPRATVWKIKLKSMCDRIHLKQITGSATDLEKIFAVLTADRGYYPEYTNSYHRILKRQNLTNSGQRNHEQPFDRRNNLISAHRPLLATPAGVRDCALSNLTELSQSWESVYSLDFPPTDSSTFCPSLLHQFLHAIALVSIRHCLWPAMQYAQKR